MRHWKSAAIFAGAILLGSIAQAQAIDTGLIDSTLKGFTDSGRLVGVSRLSSRTARRSIPARSAWPTARRRGP